MHTQTKHGTVNVNQHASFKAFRLYMRRKTHSTESLLLFTQVMLNVVFLLAMLQQKESKNKEESEGRLSIQHFAALCSSLQQFADS